MRECDAQPATLVAPCLEIIDRYLGVTDTSYCSREQLDGLMAGNTSV